MYDVFEQVKSSLSVKHIGIQEFAESVDFCDRPLYPRQLVLLKLIFLEELEGWEEDILTYWINGGRGGNEIEIAPDIRERVTWLRENGYKHFREPVLVGGRRSSKGFITGIAMAKVMHDTLMLQDPGRYYGVDPTKNIMFSCIAGSEEQAKEYQFADLSSVIDSCKVFDRHVVKSLETEIRVATETDLKMAAQAKARGNKVQKDYARLRGKALASNAGTIRGSAAMAVAQPLDARVLTPKGWSTIGELQEGSLVVGSDGQPQIVIKLHPRGIQRAFRVTFDDGSSTVCGNDHLWTLSQNGRDPQTRPLCEFVDLTKKNNVLNCAKWALPKSPVIAGMAESPQVRRLVWVKEITPCEMQCITVSNKDGLYITDDFIITHNCIDEMAHMLEGISKASASTVYDAIEPSLAQFRESAIIFCNSSPYTEVGKFHERYKAGLVPLKEGGNPRILTFRFPSWAAFEGYQGYKSKITGKGFRHVITACADWDPEEKNPDGTDYWSKEDKIAIGLEKASEATKPDVYKVERRANFAVVTDAYLNPGMVEQMYAGRPVGYDEENRPIFEPIKTNWGEGVHNYYKYKAHLDPSSTTAGFGFAMAHLENFVNPMGVEEPHVVFDIIKRWMPKDFKGGAIHWDTVMRETMTYIQLFRPYELTLDQYSSAQPIQTFNMEIRNRGIEGVRVYEVTATPETNWKRAETFKTALYQGLVHAPNDTADAMFSSLELKFLQEHKQNSRYSRIDHPTVGEIKTKDEADAIFECTNALIGNLIANRVQQGIATHMIVPGASGGYRIGGDALADRSRATPEAMKGALSRRKGEQSIKGQDSQGSRRRSGMSIGRRRARGI